MLKFKPTEVMLLPTLLKSQLDFLSKSMKNPTDKAEHLMEYGILKMQNTLQTLEGEELATFLAEAKNNLATIRMVLDDAEKELATLVDEG
tara:strand:- start:18573 stop:18842 length:270 start_codon:yes stop_codon:yes gene_type:complete